MNRLLFRIQEWLADNTTFVQYPRQRLVEKPKTPLFQFKYQMPLWQRFAIGGISLMALLILIPFLIAMLVVFWAFFSAVITT